MPRASDGLRRAKLYNTIIPAILPAQNPRRHDRIRFFGESFRNRIYLTRRKAMPRFFVGPENINERSAVITGDDAAHISRSLRMKGGEGLTLCDASGTEYDCRIVTAAADEVVLEVISSHRSRKRAAISRHGVSVPCEGGTLRHGDTEIRRIGRGADRAGC